MAAATRLVTHTTLDTAGTTRHRLSVAARLVARIDDGRTVVLLDDRGWAESLITSRTDQDVAAWTTVEDVEETARTVVGPDEPYDGETPEQAAAGHWDALARILTRHGVPATGPELAALPHDVVLDPRLRALLT